MHTEDQLVDLIDGQSFPRSGTGGCYLCGKPQTPRRIPVAFGMFAMVAECPDCRLGYQSPRPSPEASLAYMNWRWKSSDDYVNNRRRQMRRARVQARHVKQFVNGQIRLLDFGAGAGSFVRAALDQGWDATGVEQSSSGRARAKEFYKVNLLDRLEDAGRFDVITMWDVIEHVRDPKAIVKMLTEHLTDDGFLFIETGNYENWKRVAQDEQWGLYLFDHQYYFTPSSLTRVLQDVGFSKTHLLNYGRSFPSIRPKHLLNPLRTWQMWKHWAAARSRWPGHGDINIMVVAAQRGGSE